MGVMLQAFYWDCPRLEEREHRWWDLVREKLPSLARAGFTALWLPPASKAASWTSMGYDPYDYYDLGEFDQKGGVPTWFGTRASLGALIQAAHAAGLQVYGDMVFNHNSGADEQEVNPLDGQSRWTRFRPGSGRFPRDWTHFHPSPYEQHDRETFGGMPDLCHRNPRVYLELIGYCRWLLEDVGFDGFRYDCVRGFGGWMIRSIQELRALRDGVAFIPYAVAEYWDSERAIDDWLGGTDAYSDNPAGAFDFPLRWRLQDLCDRFGFSLRELARPGVLLWDRPRDAVTFVENHDVARQSPVVNDKLLAYAFILTHEGYPCVFWQDYFNWDLGRPDEAGGIAALVAAHERHAGGATELLHVDDDLYVMQRTGGEGRSGLVFVLNNQGAWNGTDVQTRWPDTRFVPVAWWGHDDTGTPEEKRSDGSGRAGFWAPPRGYVVYAPASAAP
jgi:alpha-amylase